MYRGPCTRANRLLERVKWSKMNEVIEPPKIRRRTEIDIIVLILGHLRRMPSRKTPLLSACQMNHKALGRYLDKLIKSGHVIERPLPKGRFYVISESGNQLFLKLNEALTLVREVLEIEG